MSLSASSVTDNMTSVRDGNEPISRTVQCLFDRLIRKSQTSAVIASPVDAGTVEQITYIQLYLKQYNNDSF